MKKTNDLILQKILWVAIFLNPFLLLWQWGDFTDSAYNAIFVKLFFDNANQGIIRSGTFLTEAIGYAWSHLFPAFGLLGLFFLGGVFIVLISLTPIFALGGMAFSNVPIQLGVLAAQSFYIRGWLHFDYDVCSLLFLAWAAALAVRGSVDRSLFFMFLSGAFVVLAGLARLPSLFAATLICLPLFPLIATSNPKLGGEWKVATKLILAFVSGLIACCLLVFLVLKSAGTYTAYLDGLKNLLSSTQESDSHSLGSLKHIYFRDLRQLIWPWFFVVCLWLLAGVLVLRCEVPKFAKVAFVTGTAIVILLSIRAVPVPSYAHPLKFLVPCVFALFAFILFLNFRRIRPVVVYSLIAGSCIAITGALGSNTGILKMQAGVFLLIPACIMGLSDIKNLPIYGISVPLLRIGVITTFLVLVTSIFTKMSYVYHASNFYTDRIKFSEAIDLPMLRGLRTSVERSKFLEESARAIGVVGKDKPLYVYGHTPILYYTTGRVLFTEKIWMANNLYSIDQIVSALEEQKQKTGCEPVIAVTDRYALGEIGWERFSRFLFDHQYESKGKLDLSGPFSLEIFEKPDQ